MFESQTIKEKEIEVMEQQSILKAKIKPVDRLSKFNKFFKLKQEKNEEPMNIIEYNKNRRVKFFSLGIYDKNGYFYFFIPYF